VLAFVALIEIGCVVTSLVGWWFCWHARALLVKEALIEIGCRDVVPLSTPWGDP